MREVEGAPVVDLLIRGGLLYDGSGAPPRRADIAIHNGRFLSLESNIKSATVEIDAGGLCIAPGFIDVHAHSEFTLLADPRAEGKVTQGITTEISGNCGMSAAPLLGDALRQREPDLQSYAIEQRWRTLQEYLNILQSAAPALNFQTLVGQGNIRASAMGYTDRPASDDEMRSMTALLSEALHSGALGMSTGLIYPPGIFTPSDEIQQLCRHGVARAGDRFIYTSHMRSEGDGLIESIRETLDVARVTGCRVHVSHIKTSDQRNWGKIDECIAMLEAAAQEGLRVTCDRYPYTASSTDLDAILPSWMFEGGNDRELERLQSSEVRKRLISELPPSADESVYGVVAVTSVASQGNAWMEGLRLPEIARQRGESTVDALLNILIEERLRVGAVFHVMNEDNMKRFLMLPYAMVGSDSSARSFNGLTARGKPHPRTFGSFPRFLSLWQSWGEPLHEGIRKITGLAADTFGLSQRGYVRQGYHADLVVFDPALIRDTATYEAPFSASQGIVHVLVNGRPTLLNGIPVKCDHLGKVLGDADII